MYGNLFASSLKSEQSYQDFYNTLRSIGIRYDVIDDKMLEQIIGLCNFDKEKFCKNIISLKNKNTCIWKYGVEELIIAQNEKESLTELISLQHLSSEDLIKYKEYLLRSAVSLDKIDLVKFLMEDLKTLSYSKDLLEYSAVSSSLELFKYLEQQDFKVTEQVFQRAMYSGNLEIIEHLRTKGFEIDDKALDRIACSGKLPAIQYAIQKGFQPNEHTLNAAAFYGDINALKFLANSGLKLNQETINSAARGGKFDMIKYLEAQGMQPDQSTLDAATQGCNIDLLEYLIKEKRLTYSKKGLIDVFEKITEIPYIANYFAKLFSEENVDDLPDIFSHLEGLSDPEDKANYIKSCIQNHDFQQAKPPCLII